MADFESPVPVEEEKTGAFLHDRGNRPAPAGSTRRELFDRWFPLVIGMLAALGMVALTFQTRASWEAHRDWVVPVTVPLLVLGGLALGILLARREWSALAPALVVIGGILLMTVFDIWLDADDREAGLRDGLAASNGVLLGLAVVLSLGALIWVELKRPAKAPAPEV